MQAILISIWFYWSTSQLDARLKQEEIHWDGKENRLRQSFLSSTLADGAVSTLGHACNNLPDLKILFLTSFQAIELEGSNNHSRISFPALNPSIYG